MLFSLDAPAWEDEAACRGSDPALFFGPNHFEAKRDRERREAVAKEICAACPTVLACREYALTHEEAFGVWGGLGESERRALLNRRQGLRHAG